MLRALPTSRPLWLITLADLSLLLVGFFVFLQATSHKPRPEQEAIQAGIRQAFGGIGPMPLAVEANAMTGFAPGSALLPRDGAAIAAWARDALSDPRTRLIVTGYADGSPEDRAEGSAMALAGMRAEAAAAALGNSVPRQRVRLAASVVPGARRVTLVISYDP
ncbi:flagellar motor protein MotB [Sphingomonas sp.]|jgi:flagellar motor protein MotB|uniref:flagellar motor protein MotB n=1 Tax=Sphingomonas sp. TaxID=28214 RepID=UPI002DB6DDF0|nr:flagellar motor protein MotB [Sphingomonas sp.]HEU4968695.1 flagellar motor protein MotB [Sphingomonas sp.]